MNERQDMHGGRRPLLSSALDVPSRALARLRADSLYRNSIWLMLTTIVTSLLGAVFWAVAAHLYAPRQVGAASALIATLILASNVSSIGLGAVLVQRLPGRTTDRRWSGTITAALVTGAGNGLAAALLCLLALSWFWPRLAGHQILSGWGPFAGGAAPLFALGVPAWTLAGVVDAVFIAQRAAGCMLARNTAGALLKIPLLALPAATGRGGAESLLLAWVAATALTGAGGIVWLFPRMRRVYRPTFAGFGAEARALYRAFAGHHGIGLGGMAWMYLLPLLVMLRLAPAQNAYSTVTWMTGGFFFMVSSAVSTALFAEGMHATRGVAATVWSSIRIIVALLLPAFLLCMLLGGQILALFGPGYARHGTPLLLLLGIAAWPDAITNLAVMVWRVQGRLTKAALLNLSMAALSLALAWLWLPSLGILGAGWAWLVGQSAGSAIVVGILLRSGRRLTMPTRSR